MFLPPWLPLLADDNEPPAAFAVPDETAVAVLRVFFQTVQVQALAQSLRQHSYLLLEALLRKPRIAAVRRSGEGEPAAVAEGFAEAMQGEKAPRCLLVCLRVAESILTGFGELAIGSNGVEALFDVTSCYFPITFRPPPGDPYGITTEALVIALRRCFVASRGMTRLVWQLLLEKVGSSSVEAKADAMDTVAFVAKYWAIRGAEGATAGSAGQQEAGRETKASSGRIGGRWQRFFCEALWPAEVATVPR